MIFNKKLIPKNIKEYNELYNYSITNPESFWSEVADSFIWKKKWSKVLKYDFNKPNFEWFNNGKLNITENCLDRHVKNNPEKIAIIFEPNEPDDQTVYISYKELHSKVCSFANVLKNNNVKKGDRVCIYLPMVPELAVAVLACARIGAVHSVVFAGFSSTALAARINDASCKMVLTSDGSFRGNKTINLKSIVDEALNDCDCIDSVIVLNIINSGIRLKNN
jgi:acetyl-CoA synthetase